VIGLDTQCVWHPDQFEQAVMAAASIYCYAIQHHGAAQLWTSQWGTVPGKQQTLEILAQIEPQTEASAMLPTQAVIWLTTNPQSLKQLSWGSRFMLWTAPDPEQSLAKSLATLDRAGLGKSGELSGFTVKPDIPLQIQLQNNPHP
jgi:hypothetical protein